MGNDIASDHAKFTDLTNTRVFVVNPLVRYAVYSFGMDYHPPHHMYATVPPPAARVP